MAKISTRERSNRTSTGWVAGFPVTATTRDVSPLSSVQTGSGAHPHYHPVSIGGSFAAVKRPRRDADHSPPPSVEVIRLHDVIFN
jgi:hypothetical protein